MKAELIMLIFSIGAVCGMLFEAVVITVPKILFSIIGGLL